MPESPLDSTHLTAYPANPSETCTDGFGRDVIITSSIYKYTGVMCDKSRRRIKRSNLWTPVVMLTEHTYS
jgi:hypothetical protein